MYTLVVQAYTEYSFTSLTGSFLTLLQTGEATTTVAPCILMESILIRSLYGLNVDGS